MKTTKHPKPKKAGDTAKHAGGRPSIYSETLAETLCFRLMGGESLTQITREAGMPDEHTVYNWLHNKPGFFQKYARAREIQAERLAEKCIEISNETPECEFPDPDGGVSKRVDPAGVQRNRLRVDTLKWYASKVAPKRFGDVSRHEHTGENGGPVIFQVERMGK